MTKKYILGIDNGLTVIKAVLFDSLGHEIASASVKGTNHSVYPNWVERDMNEVWNWVCEAVKKLLKQSKINPVNIEAVGVTGHGDGVYLIDKFSTPVRQGILSLDSRANEILENWRKSEIFESSLEISGQFPFDGSPAPILAWIKKNERDNYDRIRWILTCKDWIRYKLTGNIYTDFTEASNSFTNVKTQVYDKEIFRLYNLEEMEVCMPPVKYPEEIGGYVTKDASEESGLNKGILVAVGLHDVDACALGTGCLSYGQTLSIMGTWSINQVITNLPSSNINWLCRNYYKPGLWVNLSCSPASATNLDWFVRSLCAIEYRNEVDIGKSGFNFVNQEIKQVLEEPSSILFLPFLYGSPFSGNPGSSLIGVKGWHTRAHILKAIFEGVVFNHNFHINALEKGVETSEVRLTGGGAKSEIWSQMFADITNLPTVITNSSETGALGAMICASVATERYHSIKEAVANLVGVKRQFLPRKKWHQKYSELYERYLDYLRKFQLL